MAKRRKTPKQIESLKHKGANRKNIPTAEFQSILDDDQKLPIQIAYDRRNRDLDPQLVWRGKDEQDWSDLVVQAPPLFIQEKVHPKVLIDDLERISKKKEEEEDDQINLFSDFNGVPEGDAKTEFYQHDANWTNRMILGDSLQVMASLAEREGLRGKVQCVYYDPPYGIKFNSNFQWSTNTRKVKDGKVEHITREPEQVKAFRDTWKDGIHSYMTYLRDRLTVTRDLLKDSGSIFFQIGDANVHRVRLLLDEIFGEDNFCSEITFKKTGATGSGLLDNITDYILWYAKDKERLKYRPIFKNRVEGDSLFDAYNKIDEKGRRFQSVSLTSARSPNENDLLNFEYHGKSYSPGNRTFRSDKKGLKRVGKAGRILKTRTSIRYKHYIEDFNVAPFSNLWSDTMGASSLERTYVVQTSREVIKRCLLMASDPGDLIVDPTCGSGTTAHVAEHWGRRWIAIDTSRVALALTRSRIMGAIYPYYILKDSKDGLIKESQITKKPLISTDTFNDIRSGFVYHRVPHIMLKDISNNSEIDEIWDEYEKKMQPLLDRLNNEVERTGSIGKYQLYLMRSTVIVY